MGIEIERKFLVSGESWRDRASAERFCQGYMYSKGAVVRIRITGNKAFLTIKGGTSNITRSEYEYEIPLKDATGILEEMCEKPFIEKIRYTLNFKGHEWTVDEFEGDNRGLVIAEVELESEGALLEIPEWAGAEVSGDPRYYNSNLVKNPFLNWCNSVEP